MGRKSKALKSRIQNLSRTTLTSQSQEACTDDTECDSEDHFITPQPFKFIVFDAYDSESDSDYNSDDGNSSDDGFDSDEEDKEDHEDVKTDADLLRFATILSEAQAVAIKMESDGAEFQPKRGKHYTRISARTKWLHAQKRCTLQAEGQKFISHWFSAKTAELPIPQDMENISSTSVPGSDSESDEEKETSDSEVINIEEHMEHIFHNNTIQETKERMSVYPESVS